MKKIRWSLLEKKLKAHMSRRKYSPKTIQMYISWIERLLKANNMQNPIDLSEQQINKFLKTTNKMSYSAQNIAINAIAYLYNKYLEVPKIFKFERKFAIKSIPHILTHKEAMRLIAWVEDEDIIISDILKLIYGTGLRLGEVTGIKKKDVNLRNRSIKIKNKTKVGSNQEPITRKVKIPNKIYDRIKILCNNKSPEEYVFRGPKKLKYNDQKVQRKVSKICDWMHLKDVTPQTLRHSYAVRMLEMGCDPDSLRILLGLNSMNTIMIYQSFLERYKSIGNINPLDNIGSWAHP